MKIKINSAEDLLNFIQNLNFNQIESIYYNNEFDYTFQIGDSWYNVSYKLVLGTAFNYGKTLSLKEGDSPSMSRNNFNRQIFNCFEIDNIFSILHRLYIDYNNDLQINTKEIISILNSACEIFPTIEKLSDSFYIFKNEHKSIIFKKGFKAVDSSFSKSIEIISFSNGTETLIDEIYNSFNVNIFFNILDLIFYGSKVGNVNKISTVINKIRFIQEEN